MARRDMEDVSHPSTSRSPYNEERIGKNGIRARDAASFISLGGDCHVTAAQHDNALSVEACLAELLGQLGIPAAHFAGRGSADLKAFLSQHPERVASLTVLCPAVLDTRTLTLMGELLLVVTGDRGPGARRVQAGLPELPKATAVVLDDYAGLTWSDIAAERGDSIAAAMQEFLAHREALPLAGLPEQEGEIAGISYRVRGAGAPLVLLPLDLSPGQWEPLIPTLAARYCTITLGGALLGSVASLALFLIKSVIKNKEAGQGGWRRSASRFLFPRRQSRRRMICPKAFRSTGWDHERQVPAPGLERAHLQ